MIAFLYKSADVGVAARRFAAAFPEGEAVALHEKAYPIADAKLVRLDSFRPFDGDTLLNSAYAVGRAKNKAWSRRRLGDLCPKTWQAGGEPTFPCVVRPAFHSQGRSFHYCADAAAYEGVVGCFRNQEWYASVYVKKAREFRVHIVDGFAVGMAEKFPGDPEAHAWNIHAGGRAHNLKRYKWPLTAVKMAIAASRGLKVGFGSADVIQDEDGKFYVLELNTAPGIRNERTLERIAKAIKWGITDYEEGRQVPPSDEALADKPWLAMLHPALRD